jgi:hypothetical protein
MIDTFIAKMRHGPQGWRVTSLYRKRSSREDGRAFTRFHNHNHSQDQE